MNELKQKDLESIQLHDQNDAPGHLTDIQPGELKDSIAGYDAVFGELNKDGPQYRSVSYNNLS